MDEETQTVAQNTDMDVDFESNPSLGSEESIPYYVACDYINFYLEQHGRQWTGRPAHINYVHPDSRCSTMRLIGEDFAKRYSVAFENMCENLQITPMTAYPTFVNLCQELFRDGIRWGRVVALYVFGANLALECHKKQMPQLVDCIADWVASYVEKHLCSWIFENGGWDGFVKFYEEHGNNGEQPGIFKKIMTGVGMACGALGVVTLGAILAGRS